MPTTRSARAVKPRMSDAAVAARTGKSWDEWCRLLDRAGAARMSHQEIAEYLSTEQRVPGWWSQMITVGYEQLRGRRKINETPDGFQLSVSRTMPLPTARAFTAWTDARRRAAWLGRARLEIRKATPHKTIRITWNGGPTSVEVYFYPKAAGRTQVVVQHRKLGRASDVPKMKKFWAAALDRLMKPATAGKN